MDEPIVDTRIPFYTGNLSVEKFMLHHGTLQRQLPPDSDVDDKKIEVYQRIGIKDVCDYPAWSLVEQVQGVYDWSYYRENCRRLQEAGIGYTFACWLHFPPQWYLDSERMVPYRNLFTGETIPQISLWSPDWNEIWDNWYRRLAEEFADKVEMVRVFFPSEYGEVGYCTGMTHWLVSQPAARPAYWCGDSFAQTDFQRWALRRYGSIAHINQAWDTQFADQWSILMPSKVPDPPQAQPITHEHLRWIDFIDWYNDAWTRCIERKIPIVKKYFPQHQLIASLGYGHEPAWAGNDQSRHTETFARMGLVTQTPGAIGYFPTRRCSTAARFYDTPYYTEPPGNVERDEISLRIWMDASHGTQTYFEYPQNLDPARDIFNKYRDVFDASSPWCPIALWMPMYHLWLHTGEGWPSETCALAEHLRPYTDYEVFDDRMLAAGALHGSTQNTRLAPTQVLCLAGAELIAEPAWNQVLAWVRQGGTFIYTGNTAPYLLQRNQHQIPSATVEIELLRANPDLQITTLQVGSGKIFVVPHADAAQVAGLIDTYTQLHEYLPAINQAHPGLWWTVFPHRVLVFNHSDEVITHSVNWQPAEFPEQSVPVPTIAQTFVLEPREILLIKFTR